MITTGDIVTNIVTGEKVRIVATKYDSKLDIELEILMWKILRRSVGLIHADNVRKPHEL